jgi:hypothetical protein
MGYFPEEERTEFVELLSAASAARPIAWVSAEGAGTVKALEAMGATPPDNVDVLGALLFDGGASTAHVLAHVHPHGNWIDWLGPT